MSDINLESRIEKDLLNMDGGKNLSKMVTKAQPVSNKLKELVINAIESGAYTRKEAAKKFNLSYATILKICRETTNVALNTVENETKQLNGDEDKKISLLKRKLIEKFTRKTNEQIDLSEKFNKVDNSEISKDMSVENRNLLQCSENTIKDEIDGAKKIMDLTISDEKYKEFIKRKLEEYGHYQKNPLDAETEKNGNLQIPKPLIKKSVNAKDKTKDLPNTNVLLPSTAQEIKIFQYNLHRMPKLMLPAMNAEQIRERKLYCQNFLNLARSDRLIVHIGETNFHVTMDFENKGQRFRSMVPTKYKRIVASMTKNELLCYKVMDSVRTIFDVTEYLKELYGVLSGKGFSGAVIVVDRDLVRQCVGVMDSVISAGHLLLVRVDCCPYLNPIDGVFSQLANHVATVTSSTMADLETLVTSFPDTVDGRQCGFYCDRVFDSARGCLVDNLVFEG